MNKRVKELRKILNLSQTELANKLQITQAGLSKIEVGGSMLTERNIKAICEKFNVNEDWLRNGIEPIFHTNHSDIEICERLKELRKNILNLTIKDFSKKISISPSTLTDIENGISILQDNHIKLICQTFNINEDWLRYNKEPIFIDNDNYINELIKKYDINYNEINIIKKLTNLDEHTRNKIINFMFEIIKENIEKIDENRFLAISKYMPKNIGITDEDVVSFSKNNTEKKEAL